MSSDETLSLSWNFLTTCFSSVLCKKPLLVTTRRNAAPTGLRFATWRGFSPTGRQNLDGHFSTESRYAITISFPAFQYLFTGAVFYYTYSTESSDVSTPVIQLHGAKTSSLKVGGFLVYASLVPFPCFRRNLVTCLVNILHLQIKLFLLSLTFFLSRWRRRGGRKSRISMTLVR